MSKRIELPMALETSGIAKGAKDGERALKDLEDAVADTSRGGARDLDKLEDELKDVQRQSEKTERSVDDIGSVGKSGFGKAGEAAGEFKDEALSNFSEITSSFDGSMESLGELAQGTLGGIASSLPGIGLAAGVAAAGIGGITNYLQEAADKSKEIRDSIIADFLELGDALDDEAVNRRVQDILGDTDGDMKAAKLLAQLLTDLTGTTYTTGQAALAMAGDFDAAGASADQVADAIENASGSVETATWEALRNYVRSTGDAMTAGREAADAQADALRRNQAQAEGAAQSAQNLSNRLRGIPDAKTVKLDADTSRIDAALDKYRHTTITVKANVTDRFGKPLK